MINYIKSLAWADYLLYIIADPRKMANMIMTREAGLLPGGVVLLFFISFFEIIALSLVSNETSFFYYKITYGALFFFIVLIVQIITLAALVDLICQYIGYQGSMKKLINIINLSLFPRMFILPIVFIFKVIHFAPVFFYVFFTFVLMVWSAFIIIQGISELHHAAFAKSVLIFLFPYMLFGVAAFFLFVLSVIMIFGYISFV
jgi:hypothetical protein